MGDLQRVSALKRWRTDRPQMLSYLRLGQQKAAEANRGKPLSQETKDKISATRKAKGLKPTPEVLAASWTPEVKARRIATLRAKGIRPPSFAGRTHSPETCVKLVAARARERSARSAWSKALWENPEYRRKMAMAFQRSPSQIELKLKALLDVLGIEYVFQYPVPGTRLIADFYLPHRNLIVEADGARWHNAESTARRDTRLVALGFTVAHLSGRTILKDQSTCEAALKEMIHVG